MLAELKHSQTGLELMLVSIENSLGPDRIEMAGNVEIKCDNNQMFAVFSQNVALIMLAGIQQHNRGELSL